jgi:hypothetical protein
VLDISPPKTSPGPQAAIGHRAGGSRASSERIASASSAFARSASYFAPAVSGSRDGLISCYLRSASLRKGQACELEAEALETLPRLRVIGLRVRSRLLLSVEIKSAPPLDLG